MSDVFEVVVNAKFSLYNSNLTVHISNLTFHITNLKNQQEFIVWMIILSYGWIWSVKTVMVKLRRLFAYSNSKDWFYLNIIKCIVLFRLVKLFGLNLYIYFIIFKMDYVKTKRFIINIKLTLKWLFYNISHKTKLVQIFGIQK